MNKLLNDERGNVLVTAILLLAVMMTLGLAVSSQVDTQTRQSRVERERESTFNLAEAALSAQTFILGRLGTGLPSRPYPLEGCSKTPPADPYFCPLPAQIEKSYNGAGQVDFDFLSATDGWRTHVRDDRDPVTGGVVRFWDDQIINPANPKYSSWARYDADGNRHVWVRSEAIVRGRKRAIVAWVRIEDSVINFPQYAVLAGRVGGKNSGGHGGRPLVNSTGSPARDRGALQPDSLSRPASTSTRRRAPSFSRPGNYQISYPRQSALEDPDALQALEDVARANGTYYDTCPANPNGKIVVIENAGDCRYTNSAPAAPGAVKVLQQSAEPRPLHREEGQGRLRRQHRVLGRRVEREPRELQRHRHDRDVGHGCDPRRRARGRQRRRVRRLSWGQHRLLGDRVREHQHGRHSRRRPEHLARDRQPELADARVSLRVRWPPRLRLPLPPPPARS